MFISEGQNSDIRYNLYYPRWAYDDYRRLLAQVAEDNGWNYLDLWNLVPGSEFTNSAIHLTPEGEAQLAAAIADALHPLIEP
jgi:lysophospholipase L1-like esterase